VAGNGYEPITSDVHRNGSLATERQSRIDAALAVSGNQTIVKHTQACPRAGLTAAQACPHRLYQA